MIHIRPYKAPDRKACIKLYSALREAGQIPSEYLDEFSNCLCDENVLTLVGLLNDNIVACGSINYYADTTTACLSYGLVHPNKQRMGIGSIMLVARISLLTAALEKSCCVLMSATKHSLPFFTKVVGFGEYSHDVDDHGNTFHNLYLPLSGDLLHSSRDYLKETKAIFDLDIEVPTKS